MFSIRISVVAVMRTENPQRRDRRRASRPGRTRHAHTSHRRRAKGHRVRGARRDRAFITTAHRGQNVAFDPQLTTPGVGRADVWVFDADALGRTLEGTPLTIVNLFTDTPRALAVSPNGSTVYAAGFHTGNRTTTVGSDVVASNGGVPPPAINIQGIPQPPVSLIVKYDGSHWIDELGRMWDDQVKFSLPDSDLFAIDATADPPQLTGSVAGVGTVVFNLAVNPVNGDLYASNTEALNQSRFSVQAIRPRQFAAI